MQKCFQADPEFKNQYVVAGLEFEKKVFSGVVFIQSILRTSHNHDK